MSTADGTVIGTTRIVDNGSPSCRFNLVIVAEGFQQNQLGQFANVARQLADTLFATPPLDELRNAFNVYRVDVTSTDSGADDPAACGGTGATAATHFDAPFCNSGIQRLLLVNEVTVRDVVNVEVPAVAPGHRDREQPDLGRRGRHDLDHIALRDPSRLAADRAP